MKAFYNTLSKPAQDNIACFLLFVTMMCSVFCVVSFLCVEFSLMQGMSVIAAFGIPVVFAMVAAVSAVLVKHLDV